MFLFTYCLLNYPLGQGPGGPWAQDVGYVWRVSLPTVRQATYCQACTQPLHRLAPSNRIHAPRSLHRLAPNNGILCTQQPHTCTQPLHRLAAKIRIDAPKSFHIHAPKIRILCTQPFYNHFVALDMFLLFLINCFMTRDLTRNAPRVFRSPGNPSIQLC